MDIGVAGCKENSKLLHLFYLSPKNGTYSKHLHVDLWGPVALAGCVYLYPMDARVSQLAVVAATRTFLKAHPAPGGWLVACSGGQDSVVLAHACAHVAKEMGITIALAHVNYHLRGQESNDDAAFVQTLAKTLELPLYLCDATIPKKEGIQAKARADRYAFFTQTCGQRGFAGTLLAHHAQDQAETILMRLLRGTGLRGLRGMQLYNPELKVGRPLLNLCKKEIAAYAFAINLPWREDSSNATKAYTRNAIRHDLAPVLDALAPGWVQRLLDTARQATEVWAEVIGDAANNGPLAHKATHIPWPTQVSLQPEEGRTAQAVYLTEAFMGLPYPIALRLADAGMGRNPADIHLETAQGTFSIKDQILYYSPAKMAMGGSKKLTLPPPASISISQANAPATLAEMKQEAAEGIFYLQVDAVPYPHILRPPAEGDRMQPLGMQGTKLLSDMRQEQGLPAALLRDVRVLENGNGDIVWCSLGIVAQVAGCTPGQLAWRIKTA